jgi:hypothetical protein
MKTLLPFLLLVISFTAKGQVTTPVTNANFGVEGDLRANFFNKFLTFGTDDWFRKDNGPGDFIIDTTGAAMIVANYTSNPATRMQPFFRGMRFPQFSVINSRILIDGVFIRDHHGDDSTVFASGSNKNAMNPALWTCPVSQGVPDKTDILDMMMHVRRDGPNSTDPLWMFGGVSIAQTSGNRYFDFEMYQTDIYYDRSVRKFKNYGPDAGHTSWKFDAAGNITQTGDIVFTAEFASKAISLLEARIWINKSDLAITPTAFNWGGLFDGDGAGATYGYANIVPKIAGDFYAGLTCEKNEWAGPFKLVLQDNSIIDTYTADQFMEFSVNLTKLGLDPLTASGDPCKMPFRKILVKSRSSTSFTAELKDFVGPFDFFRASRASAIADIPFFCGSSGVSNLSVTNPLVTSLYKWNTPDGHIATDSIGPNITVDQPGTYIVSQELMDSCGSTYARDTIVITLNPDCVMLKTSVIDFRVANNLSSLYYEVEKSTDNFKFSTVGRLSRQDEYENFVYNFEDNQVNAAPDIYYRLKITDNNGRISYSKIIALPYSDEFITKVSMAPNPAVRETQLVISSTEDANVQVDVFNTAGIKIYTTNALIKKGTVVFTMADLQRWSPGVYIIKIKIGREIFNQKLVVTR